VEEAHRRLEVAVKVETTEIAKPKVEMAAPFPSMIGDANGAEIVVTQASNANVLLAMTDVANAALEVAAAVAEGGRANDLSGGRSDGQAAAPAPATTTMQLRAATLVALNGMPQAKASRRRVPLTAPSTCIVGDAVAGAQALTPKRIPRRIMWLVASAEAAIATVLTLVSALQDAVVEVVEAAAAVAEEEEPVVGPEADPMVKQQRQPQRPRAVSTSYNASFFFFFYLEPEI
jgi:hypothetical protein